jgi:hypothetical protein
MAHFGRGINRRQQWKSGLFRAALPRGFYLDDRERLDSGCLFLVDGSFDLGGKLGGKLLHSVRGPCMFRALLHDFLLGLSPSFKVAIHANVPAFNDHRHTHFLLRCP